VASAEAAYYQRTSEVRLNKVSGAAWLSLVATYSRARAQSRAGSELMRKGAGSLLLEPRECPRQESNLRTKKRRGCASERSGLTSVSIVATSSA
jgi:hypothetical protein